MFGCAPQAASDCTSRSAVLRSAAASGALLRLTAYIVPSSRCRQRKTLQKDPDPSTPSSLKSPRKRPTPAPELAGAGAEELVGSSWAASAGKEEAERNGLRNWGGEATWLRMSAILWGTGRGKRGHEAQASAAGVSFSAFVLCERTGVKCARMRAFRGLRGFRRWSPGEGASASIGGRAESGPAAAKKT